MPASTIRVVARILVRPDAVEAARALLTTLLEPTRAEPGCLSYHLYQNAAEPNDFTFVEEWASDAAIDAHFTTPHLQHVLANAPALLAAPPDIRRYRMVG